MIKSLFSKITPFSSKKETTFQKFILGAIVFSLITTAGYLIAPIEVRFLNSLTTNPTLIGATFGIGSIFLGVFSIYLGRLSDRFGRDKFIVLGCLASVIFPLLYASTYNIYQYMGVKFVWAFASASTGPILAAYLQDLLEDLKKPGQYIGTVYSAQALFGAISQFLGGYISDKYGISAPYLAMSAIFLLATFLSVFILKSNKKNSKLTPKDTEKRDLFFGLRYITKKPELIFYLFINSAFGVNWGIKGMLWPLIIFSITGKDILTGSIFATMGVVAFISLFFTGKFVDKVGPFKSGLYSALILGLSGLFLATTTNLTLFWIAAGFFAIGEALNGPYQAVLLTKYVTKKYRGEIMGLDSVLDKILQTIAPFLAGFLLHSFTPQKILLVFIILFWLALIAASYIYNKKIKQKNSLR